MRYKPCPILLALAKHKARASLRRGVTPTIANEQPARPTDLQTAIWMRDVADIVRRTNPRRAEICEEEATIAIRRGLALRKSVTVRPVP